MLNLKSSVLVKLRDRLILLHKALQKNATHPLIKHCPIFWKTSKSAWAAAQVLSLEFSALYFKPVRKLDTCFLLTPSPSSSEVFFGLAGEAGSILGFCNVFLGCAFTAAGLAGGCFLLAPMAAVGEIANVSMAAHKVLAATSINMFHCVTTSSIISFCTLIILQVSHSIFLLVCNSVGETQQR